MTEVILIMILAICLLLIYFLYKTLDKRGLYFSLVILNILTFILTFKITTVFKMNTNQGIITLVPMLSIFYIYLIKYGKKDIKQLYFNEMNIGHLNLNPNDILIDNNNNIKLLCTCDNRNYFDKYWRYISISL